jgi:hypothetical protein
LLGDKAKTISECTLRVFRRPLSESEMALKHAASTWLVDIRTEASRKAYSKSLLPSRSCWRRKVEFWTWLNRQTWIGVLGRWGRVMVSIAVGVLRKCVGIDGRVEGGM